jgi:hypothetical protein
VTSTAAARTTRVRRRANEAIGPVFAAGATDPPVEVQV